MKSPNSISVLLVDDDPDDQFLISDQLSESGDVDFEIGCALSPSEAHELLAETKYDAILCDYRMGGTTGVDFISQLRENGNDTPVILLTGVADKSIDQAGLKAGAADFIAKTTVTGAILERAIRYAIANADRQRLLNTVLANSASGVGVVDQQGQISLHNPHFAMLAQLLLGKRDPESLRDFAITILAEDSQDIEIGDRVVERHVTSMPDGGMVLVLHDVTERVRALNERELAQQRILHMALHDELTGLPNRTAFNSRIDEELKDLKKSGQTMSLISFDLNKFKEINDVYGHATGDKLLIETAQRIQKLLGDTSFVSRLGGDEFVVMFKPNPSVETAEVMANRISETINEPCIIDGKLVSTGASIGIAHFPMHGEIRDDLLANADAAMYRAKSTPDQRICTYDLSMDHAIRERHVIANELKDAIVKGEFKLHFQPQMSVQSRRLVGFEALSRWYSPSRGLISPSTFIPIAEDTGMIVSVGEWALREACKVASQWRSDHKIAVNVSPIQIAHCDLPKLVHQTLLETDLKPSQLELEVTEATLIADFDRALHVLRKLKSIGVNIAMDDFGTGYSSLSALQTFPVDRIKIDRSFIDKVVDREQNTAIVKAILGLGRNLKIPVLAEGVETRTHVEFLTDEGCDEMQGFLIGRPEGIDVVEQLIEKDKNNQSEMVERMSKRLQESCAA